MKVKEIQDIINFIKKTDLDDVSIETENYKIRVKKNNATVSEIKKSKNISTQISEPVQTEVKKIIKIEDKEPSKNVIVKSPMIGTFYRSPNPESDPFISEGDSIKIGQKVCIIEAMKLFNDIESEISGKIVKILVDDNSPVEFDQPLFEVDPS
ncbi:MAG: acetyl-CoA carboxylase, biotin carboxyl carrier protein [Rhodothermaeota bacterium MED-G16]|nr:MAG: acetyl-CoA carboxylase, biotin carboxyl carrier protein [Rhodothermaeota bacterium MED-G16]